MRKTPIKFAAEFLEHVQEGRKTMTRRVVDPQPAYSCRYEMNGGGTRALHLAGGPNAPIFVPPTGQSEDHTLTCPFGEPGDVLTVEACPGLRLKITRLRVERLQAITLGDIANELGASSIYDFAPVQDGFRVFEEVWDSLHVHPDRQWAANPWVWVIEFKVLGAGDPTPADTRAHEYNYKNWAMIRLQRAAWARQMMAIWYEPGALTQEPEYDTARCQARQALRELRQYRRNWAIRLP